MIEGQETEVAMSTKSSLMSIAHHSRRNRIPGIVFRS